MINPRLVKINPNVVAQLGNKKAPEHYCSGASGRREYRSRPTAHSFPREKYYKTAGELGHSGKPRQS